MRGILCGLLLCSAALLGCRGSAESPSDVLAAAQQAFDQGNYPLARELSAQVLARQPASIRALQLSGQAALQMGNREEALRHLASVPRDGSAESVEALVAAGELANALGRAEEAEQYWRSALEAQPKHGLANGLLAYLLVLEGRSFEAVPFLLEPIRIRNYPLEHVLLLGTSEPLIVNEQQLRTFREGAPDDPLPLIGQARTHIAAKEWEQAKELLEMVVAARPNQFEAQARLAETLLELAPDQLPAWHAKLPDGADGHPQIWVVRGLWAERQNQHDVAIRCFGEALQLDPNHHLANHRLGLLLRRKNLESEAKGFLDRASALEELARVADDVRRNPPERKDPTVLDALVVGAQRCEQLGRHWEAWAWYDQILKHWPQLPEIQQEEFRLRGMLHPGLPQTVAAQTPIASFDLASYPLPDWSTAESLASSAQGDSASGESISFRDDADTAGIDFRYYSDADPNDDIVRLIETTGGGVGILDYDQDGWPDLYLTQGSTWPNDGQDTEHRDRLYRNQGNGRFADVTESAGLGDQEYSQGVAIGDYNNDGYDDIYVANIGFNRLYANNGDGTFSDRTADIGAKEPHWTTSCLLADVNGDSYPDIYDVNYVANADLHRSVCRRGDEVGGCSVGIFRSEQDCLYLGRGDGTFIDVSETSGILRPNGMGLGIVAADFTGKGQLSLFIANDAYPNFYFENTAPLGATPQWEEFAVHKGLAFDENGKSQACMGVAAGDANEDGLLDLFVTNFYRESNAYYVQQPDGYYIDSAAKGGLREASLMMLGFGTQFLDADLDGPLDLILTNGHIFDMEDRGTPFRMRAQFFRNQGKGDFVELPAPALGEFFEQKWLGRGLARWDWNRDGREDLAISHIDEPAVLLTNTTTSANKSLALRLRGRTLSRDAIGTRVSLTVNGRTLVRQLTAGDGYHASNQRQIVFGLGTADSIDELRIDWPGGASQVMRDLSPSREMLVVEGSEPFALHSFAEGG